MGCGEGRHTLATYLWRVCSHWAWICSEDLATARGRITDMQPHSPGGQIGFATGDATALPLADETVDVVIASEILEHIPNYLTVLEEALRVLKPGGRLCVSVPGNGLSGFVGNSASSTARRRVGTYGFSMRRICVGRFSNRVSNLWAVAMHMHCMSLIGG